jgi:hypothetical protein
MATAGLAGSGLAADTELFEREGPTYALQMGRTVSDAGDFDADGYRDFIVGASGFHGDLETGFARVYSGKDGSLLQHWDYPGGLGAVAGAGDVNQDGYDDVLVGGGGWVHLFSGKTRNVMWSIYDPGLGYALAGPGDCNKDGYPDIVVGNATKDYVRAYSPHNGLLLWQHTFSSHILLGFAVSAAGDLNRDGYADVLASAPHYNPFGIGGIVWAYSGKDGDVIGNISGHLAGDEFGWSVSGGADIDHDGYPDFVVGVPKDDSGSAVDSGAAAVYSGKDFSLLFEKLGSLGGAQLGYAVACLGDLNDDSHGEVLIGAPYEVGFGYDGVVRLYSGSNGSLIRTLYGSDSRNHAFGAAVARVRDVNGDKKDEFVIGDPWFNGSDGSLTGAVWLHSGKEYPASWTNYGTGWPGKNGVPSITMSADPEICNTVSLQIGNSRGATTPGFLFAGFSAASLPTAWDGTLLVTPNLMQFLSIPGNGLSVPVSVPCDTATLGLSLFLQVLETDPFASKGYSFSAGLQMVIGAHP